MNLLTKRKPKRREKEFCTELVKAIGKSGWAFKIPDSPSSWGKDTKLRFTPKKAVDIICANRVGRLCAVECKMWKLKRDPERRDVFILLREDQMLELKDVEDARGYSFVALKRYIPRHSDYFLMPLNMSIEKYSKASDLSERITQA